MCTWDVLQKSWNTSSADSKHKLWAADGSDGGLIWWSGRRGSLFILLHHPAGLCIITESNGHCFCQCHLFSSLECVSLQSICCYAQIKRHPEEALVLRNNMVINLNTHVQTYPHIQLCIIVWSHSFMHPLLHSELWLMFFFVVKARADCPVHVYCRVICMSALGVRSGASVPQWWNIIFNILLSLVSLFMPPVTFMSHGGLHKTHLELSWAMPK